MNMSVVSNAIVKGGKFLIENYKPISEAIGTISEKIGIKQKTLSEAEYYAQLEKDNESLREDLMEVKSKLYELTEYYDEKIEGLENQNTNIEKKYRRKFIYLSVFSGIGIVLHLYGSYVVAVLLFSTCIFFIIATEPNGTEVEPPPNILLVIYKA